MSDGNSVKIVDFPGTYSLYPTSDDERVVLNVLANPKDENYPDAVIYVADLTHLDKHLLLLTQIKDLGLPCVLALNMSDLAEKEGILADFNQLEDFLKIPVVPVSGRVGSNIDRLKDEAASALKKLNGADVLYRFSESEQNTALRIQDELKIGNPYRALLVAHHFKRLPFLSNGERETIARICEQEGFQDIRYQIYETMQRYQIFTPVVRSSISKAPEKRTLTDRLDAVLTHKILAPILFFFVMFLVFQAIYAWAELPMSWIENGFGSLSRAVNQLLPDGWFSNLLTDGVITGLGGIMVFIPQIAILFLLITILEEVGYMARAVFIFDKLMQHFGLNGRSVVALVSGGACAIPAIMSTRTISNWRERLITIMVTPMISCSARIPVYAVLIGFVVPQQKVLGVFNAQGLAFMGLYLLGITGALFSAFVFKKIIKGGEPSWLMLELPPYRMPVWQNVWLTIKEKVLMFVVEAGKIILVISIILWALASYGPTKEMQQAEQTAITQAQQESLDELATADLVAAYKIEASYAGHLGKLIEPVIRPLGFDWKIGIALITSFAAREVFVATMATIYSIGSSNDEATIHDRLAQARNPETGEKVYSAATSMSLLVFYVFAMQCISTVAVVRKETGGWKWATIQFFFMNLLAYLSSLVVFQAMSMT